MTEARAWTLAVATFAALLLFAASGCAIRASTAPWKLQVCAFYCRQTTNCREGEIPPQLDPGRSFTPVVPEAKCETMECGPRTLAEAISAIGSALVAVLPLL